MSVRFNEQLLLWGIGVLQPAATEDILHFLKSVFSTMDALPSADQIQPTIERWIRGGQIVRVNAKLKLYALSAKGNHLMSVPLRRSRDKARIFLLKHAHLAKVSVSGDGSKRLAGDSPAVDSSSGTQGARPISTADVPLRAAPSALNVGRTYWPRVVKQLKVGSDWPTPDTFFNLYSFPSLRALWLASDRPAGEGDLSITDLGSCIGVSPRLLTSFIHKPANHYRQFTIPKRGGGERVINSPRVFLKTVQYWLTDYLFWDLPHHPCSHAYQVGHSIITNATPHVGKKYVANVDIKDFFPSIRPDALSHVLRLHGFGPQLASAVARLTSFRNGLPQGAPTSPALSNAYMFDVDQKMCSYSEQKNVSYTRYADDITFSSDDRQAITACVKELRVCLGQKGLRLNGRKTRIAYHAGQQKVTGVVVNQKAQPPRTLRRRVRAMLHQAALNPIDAVQRLQELRGYVSYLNSFPALRDSRVVHQYKAILARLAQ